MTNQNVSRGADLAFTATVAADGTPPFYYQLQNNFGGLIADLTGATNATLLLTNVQRVGSYTLTVRNPVGAITAGPAEINVYHAVITNGYFDWGWSFFRAQWVEIQYSTNLVDWTTDGTGYSSGFSQFDYSYLQNPQRFFRIVPR